jgi:hypothetical protein
MNRNHVPLQYKFLSLILILLVTTQCVAAPATLNAPTDSTPASTGGTTSTQAASQNAVSTDAGSSATVAVDLSTLPSLGSSTFTVDSSTSTEGEYKADGTELKLELTDNVGLTWTLLIPADALDYSQPITMTSLTDISSEDVIGNLVGGVLLEPDGLQFTIPATLTVSGSALAGTTILLGANQDGSQVNFLVPADSPEGASALIYHFSSAMGDNLDDDQLTGGMLQQALRTYAELAKMAKEILKTSVPTPTPPSLKLRCMDKKEEEQAAEQFNKFAEEFKNPEFTMVSFMLAVQKQIQLLGGESPGVSLEASLTQRLVTKAENMIATYGNRTEYLRAITLVPLSSLRELQLLGAGDDASDQKINQQLVTMWTKAIDDLLKELVEEHEYRNVSAILGAVRFIELLGSSVDTAKLDEKLRKALHFDLELKFKAIVADSHIWELEAKFPIEAKGNLDFVNLSGDGTGSLISYVYAGTSDTASAPAFSVNAQVKDFKACEGTAKFSVDQFFPPSETYTITHEDGTTDTASGELVKTAWETHFSDRLIDGRYSFVAIINNNAEDAIDQSFTQSYGPNETLFEIKLKHTPQK